MEIPPAYLAALVGQSRIYIRPLQSNIPLSGSSSSEVSTSYKDTCSIKPHKVSPPFDCLSTKGYLIISTKQLKKVLVSKT